MAANPLDDVVSHWHKLVEDFQTTSLGFYDAVEKALEKRNIPKLKTSRVDWQEGGALSPRREYLRVHGEHHCFDMCAAPFGNGYFFSAWVTATKARFVVFYYLLFLVGAYLAWQLTVMALGAVWNNMDGFAGSLLRPVFSFASTFLMIPVAILFVLWSTALLARGGHYGAERAMLTIPLVGWFYQKTFAPPTFYRLDTMHMFQSAVMSAMQEVLNGLLTAKGLRALNDGEFKPVEKQLADKRHAISDAVLTAAAASN
jgi:hypothetical protein